MSMENDHRTEAACLLEQGASYRQRIGLERACSSDDPIFAGFKHGAFSLYFGDAPIYHFDLEGRWQRAFSDGTHYLKGLDATVGALSRIREGRNMVLKRRTLSEIEASGLDETIRATVAELIADLDAGRLARQEPPTHKAQPLAHDDLRSFLARIAAWNVTAWQEHSQRYRLTCGLPPFLPPECQNAVVLQATVGHARGHAFGLAPAAEASTRSPDEFERHARAVALLWGKRLLQSRVIFLAGSELMHRPIDELTVYLDIVGQIFRIKPAQGRAKAESVGAELDERSARFDGVHVFLENFDVRLPDAIAWAELAARGLTRVSLGVESGDPDVRQAFGKHWSDDALRTTVAAIKSAGLGISVLTLVGAGGLERAEPHAGQTRQLIEALDLRHGDFVFLLDENEIRAPGATPPGITLLDGAVWLEQQAKLKQLLTPLKKRGIKVLPYTLEKQWA
jgi:Radical SAM superfamily